MNFDEESIKEKYMKFYNILQLDPKVIKTKISESMNKEEKRKFRIAMISRSILIILFAILFIAPLAYVFGDENTSMAVSIFCILLSVRFIDFGCCINDSLRNLVVVFMILLFSPILAYHVNPLLSVMIHFASFFTILIMTCDKPEDGNGGLFSFAYIFLAGNPVFGEVLYQRFLLTCLGILICGAIYYQKHKDKNEGVRFINILKDFDFYSHKRQWKIKLSLGIALILSIGVYFQIERYMWAGFACGSLLSDHSEESNIKHRFMARLAGVFLGSVLFYLIYTLLPSPLHFIIGPLGGLCLGFCSEYKYKTTMNCLGALMLASSIYGVQNAIMLRIAHTIGGVVFALFFFYIYDHYVGNRYIKKKKVSDS